MYAVPAMFPEYAVDGELLPLPCGDPGADPSSDPRLKTPALKQTQLSVTYIIYTMCD